MLEFKKGMLAINTTMHWNLGDDIIREGCFKLLEIGSNPKVYLNRSILKGRDRIYKEQMNMPDVVDIMRNCDFKDVEVFFSSDYEDYKDIYLNCNHYIGGRIHGSIPAFCGGADCHLLYDNAKKNVITCANEIISKRNLDGISMHSIRSFNKIKLREGNQYSEIVSLLESEFEKYVNYLRV